MQDVQDKKKGKRSQDADGHWPALSPSFILQILHILPFILFCVEYARSQRV
jgi:hypothetical protein